MEPPPPTCGRANTQLHHRTACQPAWAAAYHQLQGRPLSHQAQLWHMYLHRGRAKRVLTSTRTKLALLLLLVTAPGHAMQSCTCM